MLFNVHLCNQPCYCQVVVEPGAQFCTLLEVWVLGVRMSTLGHKRLCTPRIGDSQGSVESVTERRHQSFHCLQSVNRSTGCRILKHRTCLTRVSEDRGTPFRDDLKTCCSETSTDQHIIYNTKRVFGTRSSCENFSGTRTLKFFFPPRPQRKTSTTYPKMPPQQDLLITKAVTQVQIP
jgi:hypothetical protein